MTQYILYSIFQMFCITACLPLILTLSSLLWEIGNPWTKGKTFLVVFTGLLAGFATWYSNTLEQGNPGIPAEIGDTIEPLLVFVGMGILCVVVRFYAYLLEIAEEVDHE